MQRDDQKIPSAKMYQATLQRVEECSRSHAGRQISVISQMPSPVLTHTPSRPPQADARIAFITCNQITEEFLSVCWTCKKISDLHNE